MSKKIKGLNLQGNFNSRVLIVTHKDLDGVMSAAIASMALESEGKDTVIYTDISPKVEKTDEIIEEALSGMVTMSMSIFDEVYILDRAACSKEMCVRLNNLGVNKVVHIDHHPTNKNHSVGNLIHMLNVDTDFYRYIGNEDGDDYSACYLTFREFVLRLNNLSTFSYKLLRNYTILSDLYDTFNWTKFVNINEENVNGILNSRYNINLEEMIPYTMVTPLDVRPVNMNYIYKFMDDEDFFEEMNNCILNEIDIQQAMNPVARRLSKIEEETSKFIQYAYNDAKKNDGSSKFDSAIYNMVVPTLSGGNKICEVLFVDKPLDYGASSVAAYRFLANNPNVILVFRSKEPSYSYSVRSIGDISTLEITTKLNGGGHLNASGFTLNKSKELYDLACSETKKHVKAELLDIASNSIALLEV